MAFNQTFDLENNTAFKKIFGTEKHATPLMPGLDDRMGAEGEEKLKGVQWLDVVPLPNCSHKKQVMVILLCHNKKGVECLVTLHLVHLHDVEKTAHYYRMNPFARHWKTNANNQHLERRDFLAITDCRLFFDALTDQSNGDKVDRINTLNNLSLTLFDLSPFKKTTEAMHLMRDGLNDGSACFQRAAKTRQDVDDEDFIIEKACSVLDTFNGTAVALNDDRDNNALKTNHVTQV